MSLTGKRNISICDSVVVYRLAEKIEKSVKCPQKVRFKC